MTFENFENLFSLLCTIVGLLYCIFKYIETPRRGYRCLVVFFLANFLSEYYWTTYQLVMGDYPEVSEFAAYFGWNVGYLLLLIAVLYLRHNKVKHFLHPVIFFPVLITIPQYLLYLNFGGYINNLWEVGLTTITSVYCLQEIVYYIKHKSEQNAFPWFSVLVLMHMIATYGMWTASCFSWNSELTNPYFYCTILDGLICALFGYGAKKYYEKEDAVTLEKSASGLRFQVLVQTIVSLLIVGICGGGFITVFAIKKSLSEDNIIFHSERHIVIYLFVISAVLILLVLTLQYFLTTIYHHVAQNFKKLEEVKRSRLNFIFTIVITFILVAFSVVYNNVVLYDTYVMGNPEHYEDIWSQLTVNTLVSLIIFCLISFFYYLGYKNEQISSRKVEEMNIQVVSALAAAIDAKDKYTNGHSSRVAEYSKMIAARSGYSKAEQDEIYLIGLLHDVGKIGVPDEVINKPSKLTDEEFELIKKHPVIGDSILGSIKVNPKLATGARWHHERYGGGGYPDGISGDQIPEEARIIAVADAYDAMTSRRSYRDVMPQDKVRSEIEKGMNTQFDPRFAKIMLQMIDEDKDYSMHEK